MRALAYVALVLAALAGCYRTQYQLAPPGTVVTPSPLYTDHFHLSIINIIELSPPIDLAQACNGVPPAAIDEETGVLAGVVDIFTSYVFPVFHLQNATVLCPVAVTPR